MTWRGEADAERLRARKQLARIRVTALKSITGPAGVNVGYDPTGTAVFEICRL
jgi:hypothetical protein